MPKVEWREFLKREKSANARAEDYEKERGMRHKVRKRAQQCMSDLMFILTHFKNVSEKPARDFAKIFDDDEKYYALVDTLHCAFSESYKATVKLAAEENWEILRIAAMEAGLDIRSEKKMFNRKYRLDLVEKLKKKQRADGVSYFEVIREQIVRKKRMHLISEPRKNIANCPGCGLKQNGVLTVSCRKCGFKGPAIGDLYGGPPSLEDLDLIEENCRKEKSKLKKMSNKKCDLLTNL